MQASPSALVCILLGVGLFTAGATARPADEAPPRPTARALVAAMPADVTSILVIDHDRIAEPASVYRDDAEAWRHVAFVGSLHPAYPTLLSIVPASDLRLHAMGASEFVPPNEEHPRAFGCTARHIYVTAKPMEALQKALADSAHVTTAEVDGLTVYDWHENGRHLFLAMPDDRTAVASPKRDEVVRMARSLLARNTGIDPKFQKLMTQVDAGSPYFMLRVIDDDDPIKAGLVRLTEGLPPERRFDLSAIVFHGTGVDVLEARLWCGTSVPNNPDFEMFLGGFLQMPPSGGIVRMDDAVSCRVSFEAVPVEARKLLAARLIFMFGLHFFP